MSKKYQHLLSPVKVGNVIFKNRLVAAPSFPYLSQGPEPYPSECIMDHYANKAKSGAALVTCTGAGLPRAETGEDILQNRISHPNDFS